MILGVFLLVGVAFARFQWVSLLAAFCILPCPCSTKEQIGLQVCIGGTLDEGAF